MDAIRSISNANRFIGLLDSLIEVRGSCLVLFTVLIYSFVLSYHCFCLLALISLFLVVVAACSFFNSFHCSCSCSSMSFTFLSVIKFCCLCCHRFLEPYCLFTIITLYLFLFLFGLLTHCLFYTSYCHRYLYDLALVILVWLLTLLVFRFPYADFIIN